MNLGEFLQNARTSAGLSLEELADRTSLRMGILREMENNNFRGCGGDTYARGHLRNIAPKILADPQTLIDMYNAEHSNESRTISDMLLENNVTKIPTERKSISWKSLAIASVVLLGAIAVGQIVITNSQTTLIPEPTMSASASSSASASASVAPSPTQSAIAQEPDLTGEILLVISAVRGNSNINVVIGGKDIYKGPLFQGESKSFTAPNSISIYLSNAGDLDLTLNGKKLSPLGERNQEVRKTFRSK